MKHLLRITVGKLHTRASYINRFVIFAVVFLFTTSFAQTNMTGGASPASTPTPYFLKDIAAHP